MICNKCNGKGKYKTRPVIFGCGSMGYNLPAAVGFALAKKLKNEEGKVYCLISDGECQIGSTWESLAIGKQNMLNNLILLIDYNSWQAMGRTKDILDMEPLKDKIEAFGWKVQRINGHNYEEIQYALENVDKIFPSVIICDTIKGMGFSKFKDNNLYHYKHVSKEELEECLEELSKLSESSP